MLRPAPLKRKLLTMLVSSAAAVLTVCFVAVYFLALNALKAQYQQSALNSLTHIRGEIERYIADVESLVNRLQLDARVQALLTSDPDDLIADIRRRNDFIEGMELMFPGRESLGAIVVLTPKGRLIGTSPARTFLTNVGHPFFHTEAFQAIRKSTHAIWIGGYESTFFTNFPLSDYYKGFRESVLICGRAIPDEMSKANGGMLLVTVSRSALSEFFQSFTLPYHAIWLLDERGVVLWGSDASEVGEVPGLYARLASGGGVASFTARVDDVDMHVVSLSVRGGWRLVSMIPTSYYQRNMQPTLRNMLLIGLTSITLLVALYTLWAIRLATPLRDMAGLIEKVAAGDLNARMPEAARVREYGVIARQFNSMLTSIQSLIRENREIERERQRLEMEALQAQINPHFLFNTITSIRWVAVMTRVNSISDALTHLLRLMSPLFHPKPGEWTVRDECEYLGHYVSLMQLRFGDQIAFSMDVDEGALDAPMPRFILQPLLENSYEHAGAGGGAIQVGLTVRREGGRLALKVWDDGRGIPPERLAAIREAMEGGRSCAGGIGIANVCRRLRLRYSGDFHMEIDGAPGMGARIAIDLPADGGDPEGRKSA